VRCRACEGEQVGWVGAVRKSGVEGVEPVAAEHPKVTFGGDAASEVGVGGDDGLGAEAGKLVCLLIGQRCAKRCNPDVTPLASAALCAAIPPTTACGG
jgi:hypothetical protein